MNGDEVEEARIRTAVAGHVRRRTWAEAEAVLTTVLGGPEARRIGALVEEEERRCPVSDKSGRGGPLTCGART
ncbi:MULTISPECIES: hypothetical protein [unclassified Streptomyces]|uniref:hypothetical protein n=1 Tax=unclassified Streptomyces TaxID=2593676 RepID=UPI002E77CC62|nr:hypothetical protein [Streptomyces sp. BE133]MEE1806710.1 hypothetical protein [Streptomyces sp. BE133]